MVELEGCCPPECTGEVRDLCRVCLEKNCDTLRQQLQEAREEIERLRDLVLRAIAMIRSPGWLEDAHAALFPEKEPGR